MLLLLGLLFLLLSPTRTFNLDAYNATVFSGPSGSYFGFSLAFIENSEGKWILIGAPKAASEFQPGVNQPGAVYQCELSGASRCKQIPFDTKGNAEKVVKIRTPNRRGFWTVRSQPLKDHQMFGSTLVSSSDQVVACAPLQKDASLQAISVLQLMMHGTCYSLGSSLLPRTKKTLLPLAYFIKRQFFNTTETPGYVYRYALGQMGFSAAISNHDRTLMLGSPGVNEWTGGAVFYGYKRLLFDTNIESYPQGSLVGYAVGFGKFYNNEQYFVASAPRFEKVLLFPDVTVQADLLSSEQFGSYFGAALCVLDLDQDGLDELVVGAPLYQSTSYEEGRVHVYSNVAGTLRLRTTLVGFDAAGSRFGSAMTSLGDVTGDGYPDLAIGAPYEEDGTGCIYIYNGYRSGSLFRQTSQDLVSSSEDRHGSSSQIAQYSQRLCARQIHPELRGFGFSFHNMSNQGYGVAVGAYQSAQAVVIRALPVVTFDLTLEADQTAIAHDTARCSYRGRGKSCVRLSVIVRSRGSVPVNNVDLTVLVEADVVKQDAGQSVRGLLGVVDPSGQISDPTGQGPTGLRRTVRVPVVVNKRMKFVVIMNETIEDVMTDMTFRSSVTLSTHKQQQLVMDRYAPSVRQIEIPFRKYCSGVECVTDVSVSVRAAQSHVILGDVRELMYDVIVTNTGEKAYLTIATLRFGKNLEFVRMRSENKHIACAEMELDDDEKYSHLLQCRVGHPMDERTQETLTVYLLHVPGGDENDTESIVPLHFDVDVTTTSKDTNMGNNGCNISIPVNYEARLSINGKSFPEEVFVDRPQEEFPSFLSTRRSMHHLYEFINLGPGIHPPGKLMFTLPDTTATLTDVKAMEDKGQDVRSDIICEPSVDTNIRADLCPHTSCTTFVCHHGSIDVEDAIVVKLKININSTDMVDLGITSTVKTQPDRLSINRSSSVTTRVSWARRPANVPFWVLLLSVQAGLVALITIIIFLSKCGFFKRPLRKKVKELLSEMKENKVNHASYHQLDTEDSYRES